ncbi:hypothetical protein LAZ67_7002708 [Cordylochernes scorpioides]|uniref:Uncharacterized protein n=1 Tax=Cordylochernes scorpioides TaxID=51811 RepID=A0ABY6KNH6_9ARAC|nr:hypothetical protein LAZ67_7002708 [Cordylochernes scorpioides]
MDKTPPLVSCKDINPEEDLHTDKVPQLAGIVIRVRGPMLHGQDTITILKTYRTKYSTSDKLDYSTAVLKPRFPSKKTTFLEMLRSQSHSSRFNKKNFQDFKTVLSVGLCHRIVKRELYMIRTSSKFVLRILMGKQKEFSWNSAKI